MGHTISLLRRTSERRRPRYPTASMGHIHRHATKARVNPSAISSQHPWVLSRHQKKCKREACVLWVMSVFSLGAFRQEQAYSLQYWRQQV